jgi:hypothetical protein
VATVHRIHAEPAGPTLAARPPQPAACTRGTLAALCATPGAERPEFNRAHLEVGEIATVLDLRFADGTVVRQGSTSMRQTRVRGQLQ